MEKNGVRQSSEIDSKWRGIRHDNVNERVAQGNTISFLTFTVVKETVAKWIERECRGYVIAGIEVKGMDYMDNEVHIADMKEEIRKMVTIQSEFAEWAGMRFGIHKCAYWAESSYGGEGQTWYLTI